MSDEPTVAAPEPGGPAVHALDLASLATDADAPRYETRQMLGRGGMGEVHLCVDRRLGRSVALKKLRPVAGSAGGNRERFLREVAVQGQLEHPSIVPVYDLEVSPDGEIFFTMKRIQGRTLKALLQALAGGDPSATAQYPLHKRLGAFVRVLQAVAFAHSRGVLHRDLKPDNVMIGDFGEVYVLDWGVAKIVGAPDEGPEPSGVPAGGEGTAAGSVIGTPGYMAPEQCLGIRKVDERADIYSLGAILFELLTLRPLHAGTTKDKIESTLVGDEQQRDLVLSEVEVAPELATICTKATAREAVDRYPTVRALAEAVEHYLDLDRDVELRRSMAATHARAAQIAAERVLGAVAEDADDRRRALREAGRALALDPSNRDAVATLMRLLTAPPRELPAEVGAKLEAERAAHLRRIGRLGAIGFSFLFLYIPVLAWMGVRSWLEVAAIFAPFAAFIVLSARTSLAQKPGLGSELAMLVLTTTGIAATGFAFGPLVVVPGFAAVNTMAFVLHMQRARRIALAAGCGAVLVPCVLQWTGLLPPSYGFAGGLMLVHPHMVELLPLRATTFLVLSSISTILVTAFIVGGLRDALLEAQRRTTLMAWQLQQLAPPV